MNVAIMGRSLQGRYSGIPRYADELVRALAPSLGESLTVLLPREAHGFDGVGVRQLRAPFPTPNEYARELWEQVVVPAQVARGDFDIYHSPNYMLPVALRCPSVVTVHDLAFLDPALHTWRARMRLTMLTNRALHTAKRVICVSRSTRDALVAREPAVAARVRVVAEGCAPRFYPRAEPEVQSFRCRHRLDRPYVLFVGTLEPRKNLDRLVRAFAWAVRESRAEHVLVLAGAAGWMQGPITEAIEASPVKDRIRLLGYLPDDLLPAAYTGADLFVYPSLLEGFGLPVLEAMACGAPVLTSRVPALMEVAGDAAVTIDPRDEMELARALARLLTGEEERGRLAEAGLARAAGFRWERVAQETLDVYREAAG